MAEEVNTNVDNIGARRLHTILERILEDVSFDAPEKVGREVETMVCHCGSQCIRQTVVQVP